MDSYTKAVYKGLATGMLHKVYTALSAKKLDGLVYYGDGTVKELAPIILEYEKGLTKEDKVRRKEINADRINFKPYYFQNYDRRPSC